MSKIYNNRDEDIHVILSKASANNAASLLIPDLQRPYVWTPDQVLRLIDSLIRGWPFGTLLLWQVHNDDLAKIPSRTFWMLVDRTEGDGGTRVSQKDPPGSFQMVLDGQQRVQSMLLALSGDAWGFKLLDRDWHTILSGKKPKGRQGKKHWSKGTLCVNLEKLVEQYARKSRIAAVDFENVLEWVVTDLAQGQSTIPKPQNYEEPLGRLNEPDCVGRFIRLSRLWDQAPPSQQIEVEQYEGIARTLMGEYQVSTGLSQRSIAPLRSLLSNLSRIKVTQITYLEVQRFDPSIQDQEAYNEAVVSIFTRLNTAGRTLTREEITFAWLKVAWDRNATGGVGATECFRALLEELQDEGLKLKLDDLVNGVSFVWAVAFKEGRLISDRDLLRPEIQDVAKDIAPEWSQFCASIRAVLASINERGLEHRSHYQSLNAVWFLWAWYYLALRYGEAKRAGTTEPERDTFERAVDSAFRDYVDRWLLCSTWAGRWAGSTGTTVAGYAQRLASLNRALGSKAGLDDVAEALRKHLDDEVRALADDAVPEVENLRADQREQVRSYYAPLWVWHRLDLERWKMSSIPLRLKGRKAPSWDVDHVISVKLWEAMPTDNNLTLPESADDLDEVVHEIGNSVLLEKTFNISKGQKPLKGFLDNVVQFKSGAVEFEEWRKALQLTPSQVDPAGKTKQELAPVIQERSAIILGELTEFIRGTRSRVGFDAVDSVALAPRESGGTTASATPVGIKGKRDETKKNFIRSLKQRFKEPRLSEKYASWGTKGGSYSCWFSIAEKGEIYFGLDWDNPYLSVPKADGYDTDSLTAPGWQDGEDNTRWYDFGPVDLGDAEKSSQLFERIVEMLGNIKVIE